MLLLEKAKKRYSTLPVQVKASAWFLVCSFLQKGISVITIPIITRLLTTVEYGQYNIFNSWLGIISIFVTLNLSYGVYTQGLVKYEEDGKVFSSTLQGLTLALFAVWTAVYVAFHGFWNELFSLTTVQMLAMLVMIWSSAVFGFWSSEQRVFYRYRALVAITLGSSIAKPAVGILFIVLADDKVTAYILALALVELIFFAGLFIVQMKRGKRFCSKQYWKYAILYNLPLIPHYLSQTVLSSADRIMIGDMIGASEAGIYGLAYSISLVMTLFNTALTQTMNPWMYQKIKAKRYDDIAPVAYSTLIAIALVNLALIALAPEAVALFAPESYFEAIYVIPPVAMSVYFMFMYDLYAKYAFYYEKTWFIMAASVIGAAMNVALNYLLIPAFGYMAAGYTTLACYLFYCVFHYVMMNRVCDECCDGMRPYSLRRIVVISALFVGSGFGLLFTYAVPVLRYAIVAVGLACALVKRDSIIGYVHEIFANKRKVNNNDGR